MSEITRKDTLGRNLKRLQKNFPENYNYFPKTFTLPSDFGELRQHFSSNGISPNIFIVKPEASSQGKGIYLTRSLDEIDPMSHIIVQEYLSNPLLIDNTKFDMRIYVLVTSCDPLRIYLYKEGIARFATEVYVPPSSSNLGQVYMHLTNYSINKFSNKFVESDDMAADFGSKRSISSVFQRLRRDGYDTDKIWMDIAV
jgi:tubulin polyglutamylase TTLL6/13